MAKKKKRLPKDFSSLLDAGDMAALTAVFDGCELDARNGPGGATALGLYGCPPDLARWLIDQGADIHADCGYGRGPISAHISIGKDAMVAVLLDAGMPVEQAEGSAGLTLLQSAARWQKPSVVRLLLERGANPLGAGADGQTALMIGLQACRNITLPQMAQIAGMLIDAGTPVSDAMREQVAQLGQDFEFHREKFNPDFLPETEAALAQLYDLFGVAAVAQRVMHNGVDPILVSGADWAEQHQQLWEWLVPSSGAAATMQGEVIRASGRIRVEQYANGGANWDRDYGRMLTALIDYFGMGNALAAEDMARASDYAQDARSGTGSDEALTGLCELAVSWVAANPDPMQLSDVAYDR